jgi:hypothetical protein
MGVAGMREKLIIFDRTAPRLRNVDCAQKRLFAFSSRLLLR